MSKRTKAVPEDFAPPPVAPRQLAEAELERLRGEFGKIEDEVQRYITIYLTGLAILSSWLLGPETVTLSELFYGNGGYNVYLLLFIVLLNTVFFCFLLHKGLQIHELMQFATWLSPSRSAIDQWEQWRRSHWSVTKRVRAIRHVLISGIPLTVTALILVLTGMIVFGNDGLSKELSAEKLGAAAAASRSAMARWSWAGVLAATVVISSPFVWASVHRSEQLWAKILKARPNINFDVNLEADPGSPQH